MIFLHYLLSCEKSDGVGASWQRHFRVAGRPEVIVVVDFYPLLGG
jgi:hypothetical protein